MIEIGQQYMIKKEFYKFSQEPDKPSPGYNEELLKLAGSVVTVIQSNVNGYDNWFCVKENDWIWDEVWLEPLAPEVNFADFDDSDIFALL